VNDAIPYRDSDVRVVEERIIVLDRLHLHPELLVVHGIRESMTLHYDCL
jgi:hypothetical protein